MVLQDNNEKNKQISSSSSYAYRCQVLQVKFEGLSSKYRAERVLN